MITCGEYPILNRERAVQHFSDFDSTVGDDRFAAYYLQLLHNWRVSRAMFRAYFLEPYDYVFVTKRPIAIEFGRYVRDSVVRAYAGEHVLYMFRSELHADRSTCYKSE